MAVKVLVFGSAGNGKSTVVNACLGKKILPARRIACTAIICELKYGEKKKAVLYFNNRHGIMLPKNLPKIVAKHIEKFSGKDIPPMEVPVKMLKEYLVFSDDGTYAGTDIYEKIELFYPHPFLKDMEFIDTPGAEDLDRLADYRADVFLCVLNAQRFGASDELSFVIDNLWDRREDVFFVINKYDHISKESRERAQEYVKRKLKVYGSSNIYFASAKDAVEGRIAGAIEKYRTSGVEQLQNGIFEYIEKKKWDRAAQKGNPGGDFFSWKNFDEIMDFRYHLAFVEMIIHKYKWDEETRKNLLARLKQMKAKQQDKKLNLSVVGDFSTGKSTFINALLREELLLAGAIQGTTVVTTVMEYSKEYVLEFYHNDGRRECFPFDDVQGLREKLAVVAPEQAKRMHHVQVYLPSGIFSQDIRIMDTPGTSALEVWHEEATARAISEASDLSIILVDATKVLPVTFCTFIENHLSPVLEQCVFVVTKYDLLREKERDRVIAYIRQKLEKQFGLKNPLVLPYAAPAVIDDFMRNTVPDSVSGLLKMSYENETVILKHMEKQRMMVQAKKLMNLMEEVYGLLSGEMKEISASGQQYLEMLKETQQMDLEVFVAIQKKERGNSYDRAVKEKRAEAVRFLRECQENAKKQIDRKIDQEKTHAAIKNYINGQLEKDCIAEAEKMAELSTEKMACVADCIQREMQVFQGEFKKTYQLLDVLETDAMEGEKMLKPISKPDTAFIRKAASLFAGRVSFKKLEEWKRTVKESLQLPLQGYFDEVAYHLEKAFDQYSEEGKDYLFIEMDRYLTDYRDLVAKGIAEEEERKKIMKSRLRTIKKDMDSMGKRKFRIDSMKSQLDGISVKGR